MRIGVQQRNEQGEGEVLTIAAVVGMALLGFLAWTVIQRLI